jgi:predicted ATPase/DNA-binding CsgD family transcriptional regulator
VSSSARSTHAGPLPAQLTPFIGRELEISDVAQLLTRPEVHLATLTGPGGVGKTRLAIETARTVADSFSGGIWFVDLSPIRDPQQVIPAIGQAMGLPGRAETVQALLVMLDPQGSALFLIDNFEQVVDAAPSIGELLRGAPGLTALVTSREPLKVGGEREYPIAPLPIAASEPTLDQIGDLDSVRLFVERAQAVLPTFALTPDNVATVAEICRRLDGLPLAIELAAARVKTLPPVALLARLDQRLPLLAGIRRDAPHRQQTMRDAIAWSYALLTPAEQTLFCRLGVFVGGFTLTAAEEVVGDTSGDMLLDLSSLIDKSLVRQEAVTGPEPRYGLLETIREYALDRLVAAGEEREVRDTHAAWCIQLAEERRLHGDIWSEPPVADRALPPVVVEFANIRAALEWLDHTGKLSDVARLAGSVYWYWHEYGPRREGLYWLRRGLQGEAETHRDKVSRMWALEGLTLMARNSGAIEEASRVGLECQELAHELGDDLVESEVLGTLSYTAVAQGDYEQATCLAQHAIEIRGQTAVGWSMSFALCSLGLSALGLEDFGRVRDYFEPALSAFQASLEKASAAQWQEDQLFDVAVIHGYLALLECAEGHYPHAAEHLAEAKLIWQRLNNQENTAEWLADVAVLANAREDHESGARFMARAIALRDAVGHVFALPERVAYERAEQSLRAALGTDAYDSATECGAAMPVQQALVDAATYLAQVRSSAGARVPGRVPNRFGLTTRESDVLRLLVQGKSDREIADALFIGTRTVETHVSNLIVKLGVRNRTEAVAVAIQNGLVDGHR